MVITYRASGLCYVFHSALMRTFYIVTKWEESIRTQ